LNIIFEAEIEISECDYTCYIGYNKYGSPTIFKLDGVEDASNMFSDTAEGSIPWKFAQGEENNFICMNSKNLSRMCHDSKCSIFKLENTAARNVDSMMSNCSRLLYF
jgi:hypothetical protein